MRAEALNLQEARKQFQGRYTLEFSVQERICNFAVLIARIPYFSAALTTIWTQSFDNLSDYEVTRSVSVASSVQCIAHVIRRFPDVRVVTFNSSTSVCNLYKCRLSLPDCRKCRNIDSGNQQVWMPSTRVEICWTTIQRRVSDSVDFVRTWAEYKTGFGEGANGNFWIGLDTIRSLTAVTGGRKLRFLMKAWNGSETWAHYANFSVGPESDGFRLSVSGFSSSHPAIGDSFSATNGFKFTTKDVDNDRWSGTNCAVYFHSAWWFDTCSRMHANGPYQLLPTATNTGLGQCVLWADGYGFYYSLMEVEMLII